MTRDTRNHAIVGAVSPKVPTQGTVVSAGAQDAPFRLAAGGLIDRARRLNATFDGAPLYGFGGDTLASALLASGQRLIGRSFKYHRPRGIFSAGSEEPNALVELRTGARREPNTRATTVELFDGLEASSQNRWPSLRFDLMSVTSLLGPIIGAAFYYKPFMWPAAFWARVYEPLILARTTGCAPNYRTRSLRTGLRFRRLPRHRRRSGGNDGCDHGGPRRRPRHHL